MSFNLNNVQLAGHLTRDPQVRVIANDRTVASFSIAINRRWKTPEGEAKEDSTFVDCEAWGRQGELVGQYLAKGSPCYLEGRLRLDQWDDKDGSKRSRLKVVVDTVQFLGRAKEREGGAPASGVADASPDAPQDAAPGTTPGTAAGAAAKDGAVRAPAARALA
ncbi:MAG: single-stranded DNA-binding protein, partial [Planctomycetes bacterium]|nr:single-stranded DNA-binding protein [Planctomycetota bacterium]